MKLFTLRQRTPYEIVQSLMSGGHLEDQNTTSACSYIAKEIFLSLSVKGGLHISTVNRGTAKECVKTNDVRPLGWPSARRCMLGVGSGAGGGVKVRAMDEACNAMKYVVIVLKSSIVNPPVGISLSVGSKRPILARSLSSVCYGYT